VRITSNNSFVLINEDLDPTRLRGDPERTGRIRISNVLKPAVAAEVRNYLESRVPWEIAYMDGGKAVTLNTDRLHKLSQQERLAIKGRILNQARSGFQFMYGHYLLIHAVNEGLLDGTILETFVKYLNSEHFIGFARTLTGNGEITNAEVQSSRYDRGHFLARHNDSADPDRRYAIVFGFTRDWIADWGGLTVFLRRSRKSHRVVRAGVQQPGPVQGASVALGHLRHAIRRRGALQHNGLAQGVNMWQNDILVHRLTGRTVTQPAGDGIAFPLCAWTDGGYQVITWYREHGQRVP
jgi:hypothetical protein